MSSDERGEKGCYHEGSFDHNAPRPPIPGEEQHCLSDWGEKYSNNPGNGNENTHKKKPQTIVIKYCFCCVECASEASPPSGPTSPAYLTWARSLHRLLEDPDGADLFYRYLQSEGGQHVLYLEFWFACEGLKMRTEPDTIQQVAKVIYRLK